MIYIILLLGLGIIATILYWPIHKTRKRTTISIRPFPMQWEQALSTYWPIFSRIPYGLKQKLRKQIQLFMAEKQIVGCQGLRLNEQERVIIAAQACLLIINKSFDHFDPLKTILVYPSSFITNREVNLGNGTVASDKRVLSGESWDTGRIIISWQDTVDGVADDTDGANVIIHEFAHLLDHQSGSSNGAPILNKSSDYDTWSVVWNDAFSRFLTSLEDGKTPLFNPYGASNPAEFFAVVSEVFFENGQLLKNHEPALYEQLKHYYEVDTKEWV